MIHLFRGGVTALRRQQRPASLQLVFLLMVIGGHGLGQSIEDLSVDFESHLNGWSFEGDWNITERPGWLTWKGTSRGQFVRSQVLPGRGLDLAQYPPPWEMLVRLDLPDRSSTYAIGIQGNGNLTGDYGSGPWMQILASWNGSKAKVSNNGGLGEDANPFALDPTVMASDPMDLILQFLAKGPDFTLWRVLVRPAINSTSAWSYAQFKAPLANDLNPWGLAIEERQPFFEFVGGTAPATPRRYQIDFVTFSRTLTPTDGSPKPTPNPQTPPPHPFDLQYRATLGEHALVSIPDPDRGFPDPPSGGLQFRGLPYFHTRFNESPVSMYHDGADYAVTLGNNVDGASLAELMTGDLDSHALLSQQIGMMKAYVKQGFAMSNYPLYCPDADPAGEGSALLALLTLHELGDVEALPKALEMAAAHFDIAQWKGPGAFWPGQWCAKDAKWYPGYVSATAERADTNGWASFGGMFIQPLAYLIEMTRDPTARELAIALSRFIIEVATDFDPNGLIRPGTGQGWSYRDHFLSRVQTIAGILKLGQVLGDENFRSWARKAYLANRNEYVSRFGYSPENARTRQRSEAWALNELVACAALLASDGEPEFWDDVERYAMNHLLENQMTRNAWRVPPSLQHDPQDRKGFAYTRENVMDRMLGAFAGFGRVNDFTDGYLNQNDGNGRPVRALYTVWYYASRWQAQTLQINLWFSKHLAQAQVLSYLPGSNRLEIKLREPLPVRVRRPAWASPDAVTVTVDGRPSTWKSDGIWIELAPEPAQSLIVISLPDNVVTTSENWDDQSLTVQWRGNAVVGMSPAGTYQPYYQNRNISEPCQPLDYVPVADLDPLHYLPVLAFKQVGNQLVLSGASAGFVLEENRQLSNPDGWVAVPGGNTSPFLVNLDGRCKFYRLRRI